MVAFTILFSNSIYEIMSKIDIFMIKYYLKEKPIAYYSSCSQLAMLAILSFGIISSVIKPIISEFYHSNQKNELQKLLNYAAILNTFSVIISIISYIKKAYAKNCISLLLFDLGFNKEYLF
jgi:O-antigen/teichoic acid export membrane protein